MRFESDRERGKEPRDDSPEMLRRNTGRSVWLTADSAHAHARELPWLGKYIAEVRLPEGAKLEPFPNDPLHNTAYGPTEDLFQAVVQIVPVR